jgi:hypothetical protein
MDFTSQRVEQDVQVDGGRDAITKLAGVLEHGARLPFRAPYTPIRKGTLTVLVAGKRGGDFSDGVIYDGLENPAPIGVVEYESGTILLDYRWLGGAMRVRLLYTYDVEV